VPFLLILSQGNGGVEPLTGI